ncbi:MAG: hypothetical protein DLM69_03875 [Candidatus Chloroheliales bacterium]|nr:MAG: hypothetical protein DLM69_03875 [Chloroflexota bacterium]
MSKTRLAPTFRTALLEVAAALVVVSTTLAAGSANYAINWAQIGAGGSEGAQSVSYRLDTTIGQGIAGSGQSANYHAYLGYRQAFGAATPAPTFTPGPPTPTPPCPVPFVDINGNVFYGAIVYLYCHGAVNGTDPTHYSPAGTSTRGQFAKVVVLGFGETFYTPNGGTQDFTDVAPGYFAYLYIETGFHNGILSGFDQAGCTAHGAIYPCYLPNIPITRGQLTKLVVGAAHYPYYTPTGGTQTFSDVPPTNVFFVSIETAHYKGVINGYPDGTFRPNNNIRRDEMAQIVYKGVTTP